MSGLVERLRAMKSCNIMDGDLDMVLGECLTNPDGPAAADRIEALEAEVQAARTAALEEIDAWCAEKSDALRVAGLQMLRQSKYDTNEPEYRTILGQSQAFGRMRSFIHGSRSGIRHLIKGREG